MKQYTPACIYANLLPRLREVAVENGYCLSVHGSFTRDCDLVAVPWVDDAKEPMELVRAIKEACGGFHLNPEHDELIADDGDVRIRPHGRRCYVFHLSEKGCEGPYIDLSVMPRSGGRPGGEPSGAGFGVLCGGEGLTRPAAPALLALSRHFRGRNPAAPLKH